MTAVRGQYLSTVRANIPLCREHYRLVLGVDSFPATAPGEFVQLSCRQEHDPGTAEREAQWTDDQPFSAEGGELRSPSAFLRRPFSLAGRRDTADGVELEFIHRVVGVGTDWLSRLEAGDHVQLIGPLGNRFAMPAPGQIALLIGGGVGIPPMLYLAAHLAGRSAIAFCGAVSRDLLPLTIDPNRPTPGPDSVHPLMNVTEFSSYGVTAVISTDDGSYGFGGLVTQALEKFLDTALPEAPPPVLYTCGPEPMMKRIAGIACERGLECQVAVERAMACGMGTCQSCCIRVVKPDPVVPPLAGSDWCWRLACTDGPIFRGGHLLW